ncbi:MAG: cytochrome c biogenesis protein CcsA [Bdellovibrionaceae bacterium]|nr:cytochrome c biogenesis protein CcsA [Pseudobdellovibrionaceae bacterium]
MKSTRGFGARSGQRWILEVFRELSGRLNTRVGRVVLGGLLCFSFMVSAQASQRPDFDALRALPVQDGGRIKPFDTFAQESLRLIYGATVYKPEPGPDGQARPKKSAIEIVMTWILAPSIWDDQRIIKVEHTGLKRALRLVEDKNGNDKIDADEDRKLYTPAELMSNSRLPLVFQELAAKREAKEKLDPYFQAVQTLENQLGLFQGIRSGQVPRVVPPKEGTTWRTLADLDGELRAKFVDLTRAFINELPQEKGAAEPAPNVKRLTEAVSEFTALARAENPTAYNHDRDIAVELHFNSLHPFRIAWIIFLLGAILIAFAMNTERRWPYLAGWACVLVAFVVHTYGFGLRSYLTGRPPVSNMYETVIWVAWGAIFFAMIFEAFMKNRFMLLSGAIVAVISMIVADSAPAVLDSSLQPLEPVLRSTLWLTIHVLTITISYAALFLAWMLGLFGLYFIFRGLPANSAKVREITQSAYRAIQVGVVLLAAGIILGGVWADYSWGRFWGWDPKETWALIALLGYIALLHARLAGLVREFGMLAGSVVSASLVIMAWYGVNFVLGAGLHSYGFGAGGVEYVSAAIGLQLIWVTYVAYVHRARLQAAESGSGPDSTPAPGKAQNQ